MSRTASNAYAEPSNLRSMVRATYLPASFPVRTDICLIKSAHQELHSLGIVHRDISFGGMPTVRVLFPNMNDSKDITMHEHLLMETKRFPTDFEFESSPSERADSDSQIADGRVGLAWCDVMRGNHSLLCDRVLPLGCRRVHGGLTSESCYCQERPTPL